MPAAVPIVVAAGASAAGAAIAGTSILTAVLSSALLSVGKMALGKITSGLAGKNKNKGGAQAEVADRTQQIRQAIPPRQIVYGELKKSGYLTLGENTENNQFVHYVVALATHEVDAINTVYINDDAVFNDQIDSNGAVIAGKYAGILWIRKHLGGDDQAADSNLISEIAGLTSDFRLRGVAYVYVKHRGNSELFTNGANIAARIRGRKCFDPRSETTVFSYNPALMWRDYMTNQRYGLKEREARMADGHVTAAANISDEMVPTKPVVHTVSSVITATSALAVSGDVLQFHTGDRVQLTTTGTLPTGITAATNYFVIVHKEVKQDEVLCEIKLASSYANAVAGTAITISDAGSGTHTATKNAEPRYTACGVIDLVEGSDHKNNIENLLTAMAGYMFKSGAQFYVFAGAYQTPSVHYSIDDLIGRTTYQPKQPLRERYNAVRGVFISPGNYDQPDNYPARTSSSFEAADGGERRYLQLDLPFTYRVQTAQRLATIALLKTRQEGTIILPLDIVGMLSQPGDTITYSDADFGFDERTFEVVDYEFSSAADQENPTLTVTLTGRATDPSVYEFNFESDEITTAPPTPSNLPNPFRKPLPPASLELFSGTSELFVMGEGTVITRLKVVIGASPDGYASQYSIRWKRSSDSLWENALVRADTGVHYITSVEDGVAYDVSVCTINQLGIPGDYIFAYDHVVIGKTEPPPRPTSFTAAVLADGTRRFAFSINNPPADVRVGGGFLIRYALGITSDWATMTPLHNGVLNVSPFESNELAAGTYTLACKTIDSSGNESATALFTTAILGNPRLKNALVQQLEHPLWPGTKTNCYVESDGTLHATSIGDWSDLEDQWADLPDAWQTILPNHTTITYETEVIDVGVDATFTPLVSVDGMGTATITIKTGTDADGTVVGSYGAIAGQVDGKRYVQIKVEMVDASAPILRSISTILDGDVAIEEYADVNTATASESWFESIAAGHFRIGSRAGDISAITFARIIALQGVGPGWTWVLINKTSTVGGYPAAEFKIYDETGTLADALVDVEMQGFV